MDGESSDQDIPLFFDIDRMLNLGAFDNEAHFIEVLLDHKKPCSSQIQEKIDVKRLELDFKFDIELEASSTTDPSELVQNFFDERLVFEHQYTIENEGNSPLNKNKPFSIYIPQIVQDVKIRYNKDQAMCDQNNLRMSNSNPKLKNEESLVISCDTPNCRHTCNIAPGLVKQDPLVVTIKMTLDPEQDASGLFEREKFKIATKLKIGGSSISSTTEFEKNEVGKLEAILQWWPIILGVAIAAAVFGACVYGLVKSGLFNKARRFHNIDDSEETNKLNNDTIGN